MTSPHENSDFVIFVTHVEADDSYLKIWGQVDQNAVACVEQMILPLIEQFTRGQGSPGPQRTNLTVNALCCARFQEKGYYRVKVLSIYSNHTALLKFIDYGNIEVLPIQEIYLLDNIPGSEPLQSLPPVAHEFLLSNVLPINGIWDNEVIESIKKMLWYNEYKVTFCSLMGNQHLIKLWFNNEDFAEILVQKHMAVRITSQDVLRSKYMQPTPTYVRQKPRSIMPNTNHVNTLRSKVNSSQGQEDESQGVWKNVSHLKHGPPVYVSQQNSLHYLAPVHEAPLVFKSQVLDIGSKHNVRISYVENGPQMFSVQTQSTSKILDELMRDINNYATKPLQEPPLPGSVCLGRYTQDKTLCRAVVMSVMENKCKLYYVDFGHTEVLPYADIFQLPSQYINPKVLSIRFTMSGVKELNITHEMKEYFQKIVLGKVLTLHVNRPEGPPLIQYGDLYDNGHNVKDILQQVFSIPSITSIGLQSIITYPQQQLLEKGMQEFVHVSSVVSCQKFFVQLESGLKCLESVMACLAEDAKIAPVPNLAKLTVGFSCAALYDSQWCRAQVLDMNGDEIKIFYVDYGNEETVNVTSLRVIHEKLVTQLQPQAIRCSWYHSDALAINETISNQFGSLILKKYLHMKVIDVQADSLLVDFYDPQRRESVVLQLFKVLSLENCANTGSKLFFTPTSDNLQSKPMDENKAQHYNENWQLESSNNFSQDNPKSDTWSDNISNERYGGYETRNLQYDSEKQERVKERNMWQDSRTKQDLFTKGNKSGTNLRRRNYKQVQSCKSRFVGNDFKFDRNCGSEKSYGDKDSDVTSRRCDKQGRVSCSNNFAKSDEMAGQPHDNKWNDKKYDKNCCKSGKRYYKGSDILGKQKLKEQKSQTNTALFKKKNTTEDSDSVFNRSCSNDAILGSNEFQITQPKITLRSIKNCEIVFINSLSEFFVQISPGYMELEYIMQRIETLYENSDNIMPSKEIVPGAYCIAQYTTDLKWYRARIKSVEETGAIVEFVDYGNTELIAFNKIKTIQKEFLELPAQAVHCKLLAVTEIDTKSFSDKVEGKIFEAEFVMKRDNIYEILLREIVKGLPSQNYLNEEFCRKADLYKAKAEAVGYNSNCTTWTTTDTDIDYVANDCKWSNAVYEPNTKDNVIVTWFINPNNFYCQACNNETDFRVMMNKIQKMYANRQPVKNTLKIGSPVVALFSDDGVLYRAEILESNKSHGYTVQYVDFGNCAVVNESNIYSVEKELMQLPKLATHCALKNIRPIESCWAKGSESAIDSCFNADKYECIFHYLEDDKHIVTLNVNGQSVGDVLVQKELALYDSPDIINNKDFAEVSIRQTDHRTSNLNLLHGQTLRVKISNVRNVATFYVLCSTTEISDISDTCIANDISENQMLRCCLKNEDVSGTTTEKLQSLVNGPEIIMNVEEVDCDRLLVSLYDGFGIKLFSNGMNAICPICPMPILNPIYEVSVTYAINSANVWLQRQSDYEKCEHLCQALHKYYSNSPKIIAEPRVNLLCAVRHCDRQWYRAKIIKYTKSKAHVIFIDYGNIEEVSLEVLMELDSQFYIPHQLAVNVSLTAVLSGTDTEQSNTLYSNLSRKLLTGVFSNVDKKWIVELLENGEKLSDKLNSISSMNETEMNSSIGVFDENGMVEGITYDVHVSHADSPSQFWLQRADEIPILAEKQAKLQTDACTYSKIEGVLEEGTWCTALYSIDGMWYRAEVLDADEDITTVRFIDYGNTDIMDNRSDNIRYLADTWKALKEYSIKCKLNRVIPIDIEDWNEIACERFQNLVTSVKSLQAVPIKSGKPMRVELFIDEKSVSEILVEEHMAIMIHPNAELIDEIVDLELDPHSAFVSHINSPYEFWVQEEKSVADLEILTDRFIVADMFPKIDKLEEGLLCVAKYPEDDSWYRARIVSHNENGTRVIYIDYGNSAVSTDIRAIPEDLTDIPPLSRKCCLYLPEDVKEWSQKACEKFVKLAADGATIFLLEVLQEGETSLAKLTLENESVTDILAAVCERQLPGNVEERLSPLGEESTANILISHVNALNEFWVQTETHLMQKHVMLSRLEIAADFPLLTDSKIGILCAAKNTHTGQWQRAKILSYEKHDTNVFYIDYGSSSHTNQLRMLPNDLQDIPALCKRCALQLPDHLKCWPKQAYSLFEQLANNATMFQCETLDNEDPAHVRLKFNGKDVADTLLYLCQNEKSLEELTDEATGTGTSVATRHLQCEPPLINENRGITDTKFCTNRINESDNQESTRLTLKIVNQSGNRHSADTESAESHVIEKYVEELRKDDSVVHICKNNVQKGGEITSPDIIECSCTLKQTTRNNTVTNTKQSMCINMQDEGTQDEIGSDSDGKTDINATDNCTMELRSNDINSAMKTINVECEQQDPISLDITDEKRKAILAEDSDLIKVPRTEETMSVDVKEFETVSNETHIPIIELQEEDKQERQGEAVDKNNMKIQ